MSNVYFISDLHLGHKNILKFSGDLRGGTTVEEHDEWLVNQINSRVTKRDTLYLLGDHAMTLDGFSKLLELNGNIKLVMGNHDDKWKYEHYARVGEVIIYQPVKYKKLWLTHCPMHESELYGRINVHGHIHQKVINDPRYVNVCVEQNYGIPVSYNEILDRGKVCNQNNN